MNLIKIGSFSRYQDIIDRYGQKGCVSNDYIQREAAGLIENDCLYERCLDKNAFLFVKKDGFWRIYYYINDFNERLTLEQGEFVSEILFRSAQGEPEAEINFLESCGFRRNLRRDLMFGKYEQLAAPVTIPGIRIEPAQSVNEVQWAAELFNQTFDKWSGDFIPPSEYFSLWDTQSILIAKDLQGVLLGAFESDVEKNVNWLKHFAVTESARGKGVGKALFDAVIEKGHVDGNSRYMLWVQHQNVAAIQLYKKKGFITMGKSTLSMIKL